MDPYQAYANLLQNKPPPTSEGFPNPQYPMHPPPFYFQNPPPPIAGSSQNPQYPMHPLPFYFQNQQSRTGESIPIPHNPMYPPPYYFQTQPHHDGSSSEKVPETQFFQASDGLEDITLEEERCPSTKTRTAWTTKDDVLLLQSWLNVSKDPIVGTDQKSNRFWEKIKAQYEEFSDIDAHPRTAATIKSHFHKLNSSIQSFVGCYNKATNRRKSGQSEKDILAEARALYRVEKKKDFKLDHAWQVVKDEPKWLGQPIFCQSKRQKNSSDGTYSSSSTPSTPIDCAEYQPPIQSTRPPGQKASKRKAKLKEGNVSSTNTNVANAEALIKEKNVLMAKFQEIKMKELEFKETEMIKSCHDILCKDTSYMNEEQLADHKAICDHTRGVLRKLGYM